MQRLKTSASIGLCERVFFHRCPGYFCILFLYSVLPVTCNHAAALPFNRANSHLNLESLWHEYMYKIGKNEK